MEVRDVNSFNAGTHKNNNPLLQPKGSYRDALNAVHITDEGDYYSLSNEKGTTEVITGIPTGFKIIGNTVLGDEVIIALVNPNSSPSPSQIGIINTTGTYVKKVPDIAIADSNAELDFNYSFPIDMVARKVLNDDTIVYATDRNTPIRRFNLSDPPALGDLYENTQLIPEQGIPEIDFKGFTEGVGSLTNGVYQFVTRYRTDETNTLQFGIPCNPIPVTPNFIADGYNNYQGAYPDDPKSAKTINLSISNIDTDFPFIELIVINYEGSSNAFKAFSLGIEPVSGSVMNFSYSGTEETFEEITRDEILASVVNYDTAKCIEQKDNRLFLSNLSDSKNTFNDELQTFFNSVVVKYGTEEISASALGDQGTSFGLESNVYLDSGSPNDVFLDFNKDVQSATGVFTLINPGTKGSAVLSCAILPLDGDVVTIGATALTFRNAPTLGTEIQIAAGDIAATMVNLAAVMNTNDAANTTSVASLFTVETTRTIRTATPYVFTESTATVRMSIAGAPITGTNDVTFAPTGTAISGKTVTLSFAAPPTNDYLLTITAPGVESVEYPADTAYVATELSINAAYVDGSGSTDNDTGEGFYDYKNEQLTFSKKTYKRGEVYSLSGGVIWKDGSRSPAFHIPGNDVNTAIGAAPLDYGATGNLVAANTVSKLLGTYISAEEYPENQNYSRNGIVVTGKGTTTGNNVRHHSIPTIQDVPLLRRVPDLPFTAGAPFTYQPVEEVFITLINLTLEPQLALNAVIRDNIQGFYYSRELRDTDVKTSRVFQFHSTPMFGAARDFDDNGAHNGAEHTADYLRTPSFGDFSLMGWKYKDSSSLDYINDPFSSGGMRYKYASEATGLPVTGEKTLRNDGGGVNVTGFKTLFSAQSPELLFEKYNANTLGSGLSIEQIAKYQGFYQPTYTWEFNGRTHKGGVDEAPYTSLSYKFDRQAASGDGGLLNDLANRVDVTSSVKVPRGGTVVSSDYPNHEDITKDARISSLYGEGFNAFTTTSTVVDGTKEISGCTSNAEETTSSSAFLYYDKSSGIEDEVNALVVDRLDTSIEWPIQGNSSIVVGNTVFPYLYDMLRLNDSLYGKIYSQTHSIIHQESLPPLAAFPVSTSGVYGGDTFVNRFSYTIKDIAFYRSPVLDYSKLKTYWGGIESYSNNENSAVTAESGRALVKPDQDGYNNSVSGFGWEYRTVVDTYMESTINVSYRHELLGGAPYVPNSDITTVLGILGEAGDSNTYNTQYSFENTLAISYTRSISSNLTDLSAFRNRTVYSQQAAEDELADSYRIILTNNFYDLPKNTGEIWNTFVHNNTFYIHTTKSLWRSYVNEVSMQATSLDDIVLGTGGVFSHPSKEVFTTEGGYAGTISQWGGMNTPFGRVFVDMLQGKIFMLGEGLSDISMEGMAQYFDDLVFKDDNYTDNPFNPLFGGITVGWDAELQRIIITRNTVSNQFTWSYDIVRKSWVSMHSYIPNGYIQFNKELFGFDNGSLLTSTTLYHQHNVGLRGVYYGAVVQPFELEIVSNEQPASEKSFDNQNIHSVAYSPAGIFLSTENFTTYQCTTNYQDSKLMNILTTNSFNPTVLTNEVLLRWKKSHFQLAIPRDDQQANLDGGTWYDAARMKSKYLITRLSYDNLNNNKLTVNFIETLSRIIFR